MVKFSREKLEKALRWIGQFDRCEERKIINYILVKVIDGTIFAADHIAHTGDMVTTSPASQKMMSREEKWMREDEIRRICYHALFQFTDITLMPTGNTAERITKDQAMVRVKYISDKLAELLIGHIPIQEAMLCHCKNRAVSISEPNICKECAGRIPEREEK